MKPFDRTIGRILSFLGTVGAFVFGILFFLLFLYVGLYGWGIVAALIYALPAFFLCLAIRSLGHFLKHRADSTPSWNSPTPYPPAYLVNRASSQTPPKKRLS
jgi:hypothetical protein